MSATDSNTPDDRRFPLKKHPLNICVASPDFVGPGGGDAGASMAYTTMAQALASAGHQVTCLFLGLRTVPQQEWERWVAKYKIDGMTLVALPSITGSDLVAPTHLIRSYEAYHWLKRNDRFDIIHFPDQKGPGYHTLTAKHHGIAFNRTTICVGLHSMTSWLKVANLEAKDNLAEVDTEFMERRAVALADAVVSPSHYLLKWISDRNWEMPRHPAAPQEIVSSAPQPGSPREAVRAKRINELVYLGCFELHKGILLFCEALDSIPFAVAKRIHGVTFIGKEELIDGVMAKDYLKKRAQKWLFPFKVLDDTDESSTLDYLKQENRLAVIPSLLKNSPYKVHECLAAGIPFFASRIGGIPELIAPEDVSAVCFEPNAGALSQMLCTALNQGVRPVRANIAVDAKAARAIAPRAAVKSDASAPAPDLSNDAVRAAVQALSIDPSNIFALKTLARIHLNARCPEAAREACQLVLKHAEEDSEALQMLKEAAAQEANLPEIAIDNIAKPACPSQNTYAAALTAAFA